MAGPVHGRLSCSSSAITRDLGLVSFKICKRRPGMAHFPRCRYFFACRSETLEPILSFGSNAWGRAMPAKNSLSPILNKVDLLIAEISHLRSAGPHFRIVHRFRMPGSDCLPGEEAAAVFLQNRGHEYQLRLSLAQRLLFDFLARHSRLAQSARQIELGIRADAFCQHHAKNANGRTVLIRRIPRSAVRVHIQRIHRALSLVFQEAGVGIDPLKVLIAQDTAGNETLYRLKATCGWTHIDLTALDRRSEE